MVFGEQSAQNSYARLTLLPFKNDDIDLLISWITSERDLFQWAGSVAFRWPLTVAQLQNSLTSATEIRATDYFYKALDENDYIIGHIALMNINWELKTAVLSRVLVHPKYRRKGLGTKLVEESLKIGLHTLNLHKITLSVYTHNTDAIQCYERIGFQTTHLIQNTCSCEMESWDSQYMSIDLKLYASFLEKLEITTKN